MSDAELHDQLAAYVDGQLDDAEREAFALHLASCAECRDALHDAMQLVALEAVAREATQAPAPPSEAAPPPDVIPIRRPSRRRAFAIAAVLVAAAAAAVLVLLWRRGPAVAPDAVALATAPTRSLEGRIAYAAADPYRPYDVPRAGSAAPPRDSIDLDALAQLEHRGDFHGVAAAYLLLGDPARAAAYLDRAPAAPAISADRALLALSQHRPADALALLDAVLASAPQLAAARWNRALALRDLGLPLAAAAAFDAAAALREPGWADEARARSHALAAPVRERDRAFHQLADTDGPKLAGGALAVTPETARRFPGMARLYFYDAVRSASSADAVRALAPLAAALDAAYGGTALADTLARTERADFAVRGPLAQRYAEIVRGKALAPNDVAPFLAALRAAHQDDILLGALILTSPSRHQASDGDLPELARLAAATGDPWFQLLAIEQAARSLAARGDRSAAELQLLPVLAACDALRIDYRCAELDVILGTAYTQALRLPEARRLFADALARAERGGEAYLAADALWGLAEVAALDDDVAASTLPLAAAYLAELQARTEGACDWPIYADYLVAMMRVNRGELAAARTLVRRAHGLAQSCDSYAPDVRTAYVEAEVFRDPQGASPDDVAAVRRLVDTLRESATAGEQAFYDQTEGLVLVDRDHAAGTALLERAIARAQARPATDVPAARARAYAYSILVLDAARANEPARVWKLLGDEAGTAVPARCALGVAADDARTVVAVRDAAGAEHIAYDGAHAWPVDAATLVPPAVAASLRACASVDVFARPPVQGAPALLPPDVAWAYRSGPAAAPRAPAPPHRLVISDAEPPASLGLAHLSPWRSSAAPDAQLAGPAATPARALAEMATATVVEIHAHGVADTADLDAASLMLSPEADGAYALTAAAIRKQPLRAHPLVILAACHAAVSAPYRHETWSLPAAFVAAGASAVIASPDVISDADAGAFFDDVRARVAAGAPPAVALRDARAAWLSAHASADWVRSLMVFE